MLTSKKDKELVLYYGTHDEGMDYLCYPKSITLKTSEFNNNIELPDLLPDTNYFFIVKNEENISQQYTFKTPVSEKGNSTTLSSGNADFTVIALPDTQHYTYSSTNFQIFIDQTQWILNQKVNLNIVLVDHLGDIVDYSEAIQWQRARQALNNLNQNDIAIGIAPGNHDYNSINGNTGAADLYDKNFPATTAISVADGLGIPSYDNYPWYGGYMGGTNDVVTTDDGNYTNRLWKNNYVLFSAGGMDFINIALEFNFPFQSQQWLHDVLNAFPTRRAIISTHAFIRDDNSVTDSGNVQSVLNDIVAEHCNVFLILCAHYHGDANTPGEAQVDLVNSCGKPLYIRMSNYQEEVNGGQGFLRMMKFKPSRSEIEFKTYSPVLNQFRTQPSSQFTLPYDMSASSGIVADITSPTNNQVFPVGVAALPISVTTNAVVDYVEFKFNGQTYTDTNNSDTTFGFTIPNTASLPAGTYSLEIVAYDTQTSQSLVKTVTIKIGTVTGTINNRINAGNNDAEENRFNSGSVDLTSSDLELYTDEGVDPQYVGLRFTNLSIPQGATITSSYIEFTVDEVNAGNVTITINGEATDNTLAFTTTPFNISSRPKTTSIVNWSPIPWLNLDSLHKTTSLNAIIQEVVNRQGWMSGNAMAFLLYGNNAPTNTRIAESFEGKSTAAPLLHIEYTLGPCQPITYYADADNDGFGDANITLSQCEQPLNYVLNNLDCNDVDAEINPNATEIPFNGKDDDCNPTTSDTPSQNGILNIRVNASEDDAEENRFNNGAVDISSADLELYTEENVDPQYVGLRFKNIVVPHGATITSAYIEFTVDEVNSGDVIISISGETTANPLTFAATPYNISSRPKTLATVNWSPIAWLNVDDIHQTTSLKIIVQELIDRQGWVSGNAMAFLLYGGNTPTNARIAESFDGESYSAPLLHIEYSMCQPQTFYADNDGDGYGNPAIFVAGCAQPVHYVTNKSDCNDIDASINPGAIETPYNGKDDDCNPMTKDDDLDGDGYALANDCDDSNAAINPNSVEILYDGIDNNCNGVLDEGAPLISAMKNCGSILNNSSSLIFCTAVSGVSGYRFEIAGPNGVQTIDKNLNFFNLSELSNFSYGTTYAIRVQLKSSATNIWVGYYGSACNYTLGTLNTNSSNILSVCGQTLSTIGTTLTAKAILGALGYRFRIINLYTGQTQIIDRTAKTFVLTQLNSFHYATNYSIDVATRFTSAFPSNPSYGAPCIVRTPNIPALTALYCNKSVLTKTTAISTTIVSLATGYRFEVTRWTDSSLSQMVSISTIDRTSNSFNFTQINNYAPSTYYTVRVSVKTSGTFPTDQSGQTLYGTSCTIISPLFARVSSSINDNFEVKLIPNPFDYQFNISLETSSGTSVQIKVYDTVGRELESFNITAEEVSSLTMGERYPSGIYNVIISQDDNQKVLRIIKK
ncbi:MopE-related protein [Flavobacterium sp.]